MRSTSRRWVVFFVALFALGSLAFAADLKWGRLNAIWGTNVFKGLLIFDNPPQTTSDVGTVGTTRYISAVEQGDGLVHRTTLTISSLPVTLTRVTTLGGYGSTKLYTWPQGAQAFLGCTSDLTIDVSATPAWTVTTAWAGAGTATAAADTTLTATEQDLLPSTDLTILTSGRTTYDLQPVTTFRGFFTYDGTTTAAKMWLNVSAVSADIGTTGQTATVSGTVKCSNLNLGDN